MSKVEASAPLPVLSYAVAPAAGSGRDRFLRIGGLLGLFACALTILFIPLWCYNNPIGPARILRDAGYDRYEDSLKTVVPLLQALLMGSGLALTLAGRPASRELRRHPRYPYALMLNLLVLVALVSEWSLPTHPVYPRWIPLGPI